MLTHHRVDLLQVQREHEVACKAGGVHPAQKSDCVLALGRS
jgi:hypothetical protein